MTLAHQLSCIICAFNEAERIDAVLRVASGHPLIEEIVVVDDGSTDDTAARAHCFPRVRLIELSPNGGKTAALAAGVAAARGDHLILLDADLEGLVGGDLSALARPVFAGEAESSISLRGDTLGVYRAMGLDFVSGERVLPRRLLADVVEEMKNLPRWGCEVFINERIIDAGLRVAVVDWPNVTHTRKHHKVGALRGVAEEARMIGDALRVLKPLGVVRQHVELIRLTR